MWKKSMLVAMVLALSAGAAQASEPRSHEVVVVARPALRCETEARANRAQARALRDRAMWARMAFRFGEARELDRRAIDLDQRAAILEQEGRVERTRMVEVDGAWRYDRGWRNDRDDERGWRGDRNDRRNDRRDEPRVEHRRDDGRKNDGKNNDGKNDGRKDDSRKRDGNDQHGASPRVTHDA